MKHAYQPYNTTTDMNTAFKASDHSQLSLFDFVLVRDKDSYPWKPQFFMGIQLETGPDENDYDCCRQFNTADGCRYRQCIPYTGNEDMAFTCRNLSPDALRKPADGEAYYYVKWNGTNAAPCFYMASWNDMDIDNSRLLAGNCFRTEAEAREKAYALKMAIKEILKHSNP